MINPVVVLKLYEYPVPESNSNWKTEVCLFWSTFRVQVLQLIKVHVYNFSFSTFGSISTFGVRSEYVRSTFGFTGKWIQFIKSKNQF